MILNRFPAECGEPVLSYEGICPLKNVSMKEPDGYGGNGENCWQYHGIYDKIVWKRVQINCLFSIYFRIAEVPCAEWSGVKHHVITEGSFQ